MTTYPHTAEADIAADTLFGFLAEPRNLPRYFPQMTVAVLTQTAAADDRQTQ